MLLALLQYMTKKHTNCGIALPALEHTQMLAYGLDIFNLSINQLQQHKHRILTYCCSEMYTIVIRRVRLHPGSSVVWLCDVPQAVKSGRFAEGFQSVPTSNLRMHLQLADVAVLVHDAGLRVRHLSRTVTDVVRHGSKHHQLPLTFSV